MARPFFQKAAFDNFGNILVFCAGGCQGYMMLVQTEFERLISQVKKEDYFTHTLDTE
jgi:hypothetical protein